MLDHLELCLFLSDLNGKTHPDERDSTVFARGISYTIGNVQTDTVIYARLWFIYTYQTRAKHRKLECI